MLFLGLVLKILASNKSGAADIRITPNPGIKDSKKAAKK
ncbi:Uncharacterised protein [Afipia felis]|nr:Uncharacterised protein [Afipia felis]